MATSAAIVIVVVMFADGQSGSGGGDGGAGAGGGGAAVVQMYDKPSLKFEKDASLPKVDGSYCWWLLFCTEPGTHGERSKLASHNCSSFFWIFRISFFLGRHFEHVQTIYIGEPDTRFTDGKRRHCSKSNLAAAKGDKPAQKYGNLKKNSWYEAVKIRKLFLGRREIFLERFGQQRGCERPPKRQASRQAGGWAGGSVGGWLAPGRRRA